MEGNYYNNILASFMFTYLDLIFWCTFPYINHIFFQELECIIYVFHNAYMYSTLTALSFNDDDQQIPPFMMTIRIILTFLFGKETKVDLLNSSTFVQTEFVSPEHMKESSKLSFSDVLNDDRLQVKNVVFHACKDALSVLENPSDSHTEK